MKLHLPRSTVVRGIQGAILGAVAGMAADALNANVLLFYFQHLLLLGIVIGLGVGLTRASPALWWINAAMVLAFLIIGYSPMARWLAERPVQSDALAPADAVVVLAGGYINDQTLGARAQDRLLHGIELLRGHWAKRLIITEPGGPEGRWSPLVARELNELGIDIVPEVVGPVVNTHDESLAISAYLKKQGIGRVILVTHDWHMPRASALFVRAGVDLLRSPCADSTYDELRLATPSDRLAAFRDWLHERVGLWVYHWRGWL